MKFYFLVLFRILEFNFCYLNKNTKKIIGDREIRNSINENKIEDDDEEIDIKGYDISEAVKIQKNMEDLNEMKEIFEDNNNDD